jgi:hypothetical protein
VGGNKASLDGVNEYRQEAYARLLFGASSDRSRSCDKITEDVYIDYNAVDAYIPAQQTKSLLIGCMNFRHWTGNTLNCFVTTASWHRLIWQPNFANSSADPALMQKQPLVPHKTHAQLSQ